MTTETPAPGPGPATDHTSAHEYAAPMAAGRQGPLIDVRVLDLTGALAGPYCTMLLGDLGADIIHVEPPAGDGVRLLGPHTEADEVHHYGGYYASSNRNKRSITLDLKDDADRATFLRLVDNADILVENYRAGVMDKLGLSYETLAERNPSLVYGAIRGFGDPRSGEGPYTWWPAYDVVAQSMGGLISHTGTKEGERVASGPSMGDIYPATMMAAAVIAGLHHARRTGEGQFVDVGMMDAIMGACESMTWRWTYMGQVQPPRGSEHPSLCPFELYDAADGQIAIAAPRDHEWTALCEIIGEPDFATDDRYRSARRRVERREEVRTFITAWTSVRTRREISDALAGKVPHGPVNTAPDLVTDPHVRARQMYVAVEHQGSDRPVLTPNTPMRFSGTPGGVYMAAPMLNQHRDEILAELDDLDAARAAEAPAAQPTATSEEA